ncbi:MAG: LamG-like jellyroll fold domain-containing protein [Bacteroidota bacterium]
MKKINLVIFLLFLFAFNTSAMQIFVETPSNGTLTLDVEPTDIIQNLKSKITDYTSIDAALMILKFNSVLLEDNRTIADYSIAKDDIIVLTLKIVNALDIDGTDDYVSIASGTGLVPTSGDYTVSIWAKQNASQLGSFFELYSQGNNIYLGGNTTGGIRVGDNWGTTGVAYPTDGQWHYFTVVKSGLNGYLYLDGSLVAKKTGGFVSPTSTTFLLGKQYSPHAEYFNGQFDELSIWSKALTASEIRTSMGDELVGTESGLLSYYNFNQGIAAGNNSAITTLTDSKGLNNGTLVNLTKTAATSNFVASTAISAYPNNGLNFDGIDDNVTAGSWFNFNTFTLSMWLNPGATQNTYADIIDNNHVGNDNWVIQQNNTTTNEYNFKGVTFTLPANQWSHLTVVCNNLGTSIGIFVNGNLVATGSSSFVYNGTQNLILGSHYSIAGRQWNGTMDELSIWNRVLTTEEIRNNMNSDLVGNESGLLAYCNFDQGIADGNNTAITTFTSKTGSINCTLNSFAKTGTSSNFIASAVPSAYVPMTAPGNALSFDGVNDYVSIEDATNLNPGNQNLTIECWFNASNNNAGEHHLFNKEDLYEASIIDGYFRFALMPNWTWQGGTSFPVVPGQWYHIAVVYDHTNITIYKNGELFSTLAKTDDIGTTTTKLLIGARAAGTASFFEGKIDELRVWSDARTACEINYNMARTLVGDEDNLVAYYNFDNGIAGGTNVGITDLSDIAGSDNNGTLTNFALSGSTSNWVDSQAGDGLPVITTTGYSAVLATTADVACSITSVGAGNTTVRGVCYSTNSCPTVNDSKTQTTGSYSTGAFTISLSGLSSNTTYYARSFTTNANGTSYGEEISFKTRMSTPGNALSFDGVNDYVSIDNAANLNAGSQDFTVECWFNASNNHAGEHQLFNKESLFQAAVFDGYFNFALMPNWQWLGTNLFPVVPGQWYHVAIVYNHTNIKFYKNGVLLATYAKTGDIGTNATKLLIGARGDNSPNSFFEGKIDELRIWSNARTACEINANISGSLVGNESGLVAYYNFDNGLAGATNTGVTSLTDIAGADNTGTLTNFALTGSTSNWVDSQAGDGLPVISTTGSSSVLATTADVSCNITSVGVGNTSVRGVCYRTSSCPTVNDSKTQTTGTYSTGTYTISLSGLASNTTYYARAYTTNANGTSYGEEISFKTRMSSPGNALSFDGADDYVEISNPYTSFTDAITVEMWVNYTGMQVGSGIGQSASNSDSPTSNVWVMHGNIGDGTMTFFACDESESEHSAVCSTVLLNTGWHHVVGVANTTEVAIYIDGVKEGTGQGIHTSIKSNPSAVMHLGKDPRYASGRFMGGKIDELRIWNTARTACEINANISNSLVGNEPGLVAYYNFDNGVAGATNTGVTTLSDLAGADNTGALNNFALTGSTSNWVDSEVGEGFPVISTTGSANIQLTTADVIGNITDIGAENASARGICYSTNACPTINDSKTETTGSYNTGAFSISLGGLSNNTIYYARAYATNAYGTSYGEEISFKTNMIPPGNCLDLDGSDDYVSFPSSPAYDNNNFTIEAWIKTTTMAAEREIVGWGKSGSNDVVEFRVNNNKLQFGIDYGGWSVATSTSDVNTGNWTHVAAVKDGTTVKLYVNGKLDATESVTGTPVVDIMEIGNLFYNSGQRSYYFPGDIDEVRIWNSVRTQVQIAAGMKNVVDPALNADLIAYYQFDHGIAGGTNTGITSLLDKTTNAKNGTLNNFGLTGSTTNWVESYAMITPDPQDAANSCDTTTTISWTAPAIGTVESYYLEVATDLVFANKLANYDPYKDMGTSLSEYLSGLTSAQTYYYRVRAFKTSVRDVGAIISVDSVIMPLPITATISQVDVSCPGGSDGSATITATGGTGILTYLWSNNETTTTISDLTADTYYCTITDANLCVNRRSVGISDLDGVKPTITAPDTVNVTTDTDCTATGVSIGTPVTADNCAVASVTNDAPLAYTLGENIVTWTVTDASGNTETATQIVNVADNVKPTITAPSTVNVNTNNGCTATGVYLGIETTADNCSVASVSNNAPTDFALGATTVTWTVTDGSGNTETATQIVNVADISNPTITAPSNINTVTNDACTATGVDLGSPTTGDNCSVNTTTNDAPATFPLGETTVTWTVTDGTGNSATATQTVTVVDNVLPEITAPATVNVTTNTACTATGVSLGTPVTSDNCSVLSVENDAPLAFELGETTVTWTVKDGSGNTATATQTVSVTDDVDPTITAPAEVNATTNNGCTATGIALGTPITSDNCSVASVTNDAPLAFPKGATTVVWTITDGSGNTATATQTVNITDNTNPSIIAPENVSVTTDLNCIASGIYIGAPITSDNCSVANVTSDQPAEFPLGSTTVTWTVTDESGNTATATQTINVTDDVDPTITAPATLNISTNSACSATGVALGMPITADNCSVASIINDAPVSFEIGATTVIWTVTDGSGNTATANQTVNVADNEFPTITAPDDIIATTNNACTATEIDLGTPITADNCSSSVLTNDAPAAFPVGETLVTWTITDGNGNATTAIQKVTITDNENPVITAPATVNVTTNLACTATGIALGTPTTSDNCSIASVTNNAPTAFPKGTTTVVWTVTDGSGRTATANQSVIVTDNVNPTITAPNAVSATTNSGCTATGIALGTPVSADNCSVASVTNNAPTAFPLGETTVVWTVTDGSGNTATANQIVTITDNVNPAITAPSAINTTVSSGCTATGIVLGTPVTTDNCSVASVTNNAPAAFALGATTVVWTVTDGSGNIATANQIVTITDNVNPTITAPSAVSTTVNSGCTAINVALGTPVTADNCSVASVVNNAPTAFPLGETTVIWTVTDGSGRTATANQIVTVVDNVDPTITAPTTVNAIANSGCTATGVSLGTPSTADNCSVASVSNNAPTAFPLGETIVTWTVTDGNGNTATSTQSVNVIDNVSPTITAPATVYATTNLGCTATGVDLGTPTTTGNCSSSTVTNNAPSEFPKGTTTVTWTIVDGMGRRATSTQTVIVTDNIDPTITAPPTVDVYANTGCTATGVYLGTPVTADNCAVETVTNNAPVAFPLGSTTVTWTVTDRSGRTATATQIINVNDNVNPTITAPANITRNINSACTATGIALGTPSTSDNCSVSTITNNAPSSYPVGATTVVWTVTDGSGNTSTANQIITVVDNINPTITAPSALDITTNSACFATNVALGTPIAADNCSTPIITNDAPSDFPLGTTTVTWTATDAGGRTATATQTVNVTDNVNPIAIAKDIAIDLDATGNVTITADDINNASTDNCSILSIEASKTAFDCSNLGENAVTLTVTDESGNVSTADAIVTVNTPLAINLTLSGTSQICYGSGANITVASSVVGMMYQLRNDNANELVGSAIAGNGTTISLPTGNLIATTTFNVLVTSDASGCSAELAEKEVITVVNIPSAPDAIASLQPTCSVATGSLTVTSNITGLSFSIDGTDYSNTSGIFTSLNSGSYTVTAKNSLGCVSNPSSLIIINTQPLTPNTPILIVSEQPTCLLATGTIAVTSNTIGLAFSLDGVSYSNTSGVFSGLTAGNYSVTAKNTAGCISNASAQVIIDAQPLTPATPQITLVGNVLHSNVSTGNQWYNQNGIINNATNQDYTPTINGNYYVVVSSSGCSSAPSNIINVTFTGIEATSIAELNVYPNPANETITISGANNSILEIIDLIGQVVIKNKITSDKKIINVSNLKQGTYTIKVKDDYQTRTMKFQISR